jgi:hypothetical protein
VQARPDAFQRAGQFCPAHRLQQVIDRITGERVQRVALVGGGKDDERTRLRQRGGQRGAAHLGHLDIEEQHVGLPLADQRPRRCGVAAFTYD